MIKNPPKITEHSPNAIAVSSSGLFWMTNLVLILKFQSPCRCFETICTLKPQQLNLKPLLSKFTSINHIIFFLALIIHAMIFYVIYDQLVRIPASFILSIVKRTIFVTYQLSSYHFTFCSSTSFFGEFDFRIVRNSKEICAEEAGEI